MWFTANLLFKSNHPDHPEDEFFWEERVFLRSAETADEARQKGERIGKSQEHEYIAANGDRDRWTFERVESTFAIDSETISDRTDVFSRFLSSSEVESILSPFTE